MSRRRTQVKYTRLPQGDVGDDNVDARLTDDPSVESPSSSSPDEFTRDQFNRPPPKIPYKAILLSCFLFIVGSISLVCGALIATGLVHEKYLDRLWPLFILGSIMFIPGFYHVRIAYLAFRKRPGYSFDDIPEFNR